MSKLTNMADSVPRLSYQHPSNDRLRIILEGAWLWKGERPSEKEKLGIPELSPDIRIVEFDCSKITAWDSSFLTFLLRLMRDQEQKGRKINRQGLPEGVQRLLNLTTAVPEKKVLHVAAEGEAFCSRLGQIVLNGLKTGGDMVTFLGETVQVCGRVLRGKAHFRRTDMTLLFQECGIQALPIVSLISVLVGLILAFVGSIQLEPFGAQIYIANLVGIAMAREMGAMMTAIIMAGRTGAAFAAQLGTMEVNEEIDALKTFGFSPMEFLVLPRTLALILMMPLLCLYADLMGILGGALVGIGMFDLTPAQYLLQTSSALSLNDFTIGVIKCSFFGILVAISGCYQGIKCGRSASAVGEAATSAVVMAIVMIILFDGLFAVLTSILNI